MPQHKFYFEVEIMSIYMNHTIYKYKVFLNEINALKFVAAHGEHRFKEQGWCTTGKIEKKIFTDYE